MKLLIKVYFPNVNPYDLMTILEIVNNNITDKENTKICIMTDNPEFDFETYEYYYLNESIPKMINYKLSELKWDIIMPIIRPSITNRGFDSFIVKNYKEQYPNFDGVLWLNDNAQNEINTYPVIGRKYYEECSHIYNPIYHKTNFEKEFSDVMKIKNKYYFVNKVCIKPVAVKLDDDNIYELRQKINFGL
jgi:hypothetical protein